VDKNWKFITGFALVGLPMTGLSYAYAAFCDYTKPLNGLSLALSVLSVILCPAQLFFAFCIDCEVIGRGGFIMYSIIGVLNMPIYAVFGALVVGLRKTKSN
jgi:hypothetical protein